MNSRTTRMASIVLGVLLLAAPAYSARTAIATAKPNLRIIQVDGTGRVTTTNGTKLDVAIYARYRVNRHGGTFRITLSSAGTPGAHRPSGAFGEKHAWTFGMPGKRLATVDRAGHATLRLSHRQLGKYGAIDLEMTPGGPGRNEVCNDGRRNPIYNELVGGRLSFDTNTRQSGWAIAHARGRTLRMSGHTRVLAEYDQPVCTPTGHFHPASYPCPGPITWLSHGARIGDGRGTFSGGIERINGKPVGYVSAGAGRRLSGPKRAFRDDAITLRAPKPRITHNPDGTTTLTVTTRGPRESGSLTVRSSKAAKAGSDLCGPRGKNMVDEQLWRGPLRTDPTPLTLQPRLFNPFRNSKSHADFAQRVATHSR